MTMNRWGYFVSDGTIHRDWRSPYQTFFLSPLGLVGMEMKKNTKKAATKKSVSIVLNGTILSLREYDDFIGRDPQSVR